MDRETAPLPKDIEKALNVIIEEFNMLYQSDTLKEPIYNAIMLIDKALQPNIPTAEEIVKELNEETPNLEWHYDTNLESFWGEHKNGISDMYEISVGVFEHMPKMKTAHKITTFFMNEVK